MSDVDICNRALRHLGVSVEIANLATEKSKEAKACRRFYEDTRDEVLRDFDWPFARVSEVLALVEDFTADADADHDWSYAYRYPADAVAVRRVVLAGWGRRERAETKTRYLIGRDDTAALLFTDLSDAVVEYTFKETDPSKYPPDFRAALSRLLAHYIGPSIAGDKVKVVAEQLELYDYAIRRARANALNEQLPDAEPQNEFLNARGLGDDLKPMPLRP